MKILITIGHPAHVHFYKIFIWEMQKRGHIIKIAAREKDVSLGLLDAYGLKYDLTAAQKSKGLCIIKEQLSCEHKLYKIAKNFKPDIITGIGGTAAAHVSKLTKSYSIIFTDYPLWYDKFITYPWADIIITPTSFSKYLGKKQLKIESYKELAYLHPIHFVPDEKIFDLMGINKNKRFVIVRFASFDAAHDVGISGFDTKTKLQLVNQIERYAKVFVVSAGELPRELDKYILKVPLEKIHDVLYYADLLVSDSQTMTTEAAVLGTPVVRSNSWVGPKDAMNFVELEKKYKLVYNFSNPKLAIDKCIQLLNMPNMKKECQKNKEKLISEKIDFTRFLIWLTENHNKKYIGQMQYDYKKYLGASQ